MILPRKKCHQFSNVDTYTVVDPHAEASALYSWGEIGGWGGGGGRGAPFPSELKLQNYN